MCFTFLAAQGERVGALDARGRGRPGDGARADGEGGAAQLPAPAAGRRAGGRPLRRGRRPRGGPDRRDRRRLDRRGHRPAHRGLATARRSSLPRTVFWNGPMGAFEIPPFADGTRAVAEAMAECPGGHGRRRRRLGRGRSPSSGCADRLTHVSTGGGAALEMLEGRTLPGVAALPDRGERPPPAGRGELEDEQDRRRGARARRPPAGAARRRRPGRRRRGLPAVHRARGRRAGPRPGSPVRVLRPGRPRGALRRPHRRDLGRDDRRDRRRRHPRRPLRAPRRGRDRRPGGRPRARGARRGARR